MNYAELIDTVNQWTKRVIPDTVLPTLITMGEAMIAREVRAREDLVIVSDLQVTEAGSYLITLPSDLNRIFEFYRPGSLEEATRWELMTEVGADTFRSWPNVAQYPGPPTEYVQRGLQVEINALADDTLFRLVYYQDLPRLSVTVTSNWILAKHPDVYVYATLVQAIPWLKDDIRLENMDKLFSRAVNSIKTSDWGDRYAEAGSLKATIEAH